MLEVKGLDSFYGRAHILSGLDLAVGRGEVVALLGRNGAGKSTTLKSIVGLVPPAAGEIRFAGKPIQCLPPFAIARLGIGYVPEERRIFAELTLRENLETGRRPARAGASAWTPQRLYELFPPLADLAERRAGSLSGGEQQMLTIARTLMGNPKLLLLDEPSEGLAPLILERLAATLRALKEEGLAMLLAEQNFRFAAALSDRAYVIEKGQIRYQSRMAALAADASLRETYLGF
jgi:branched-chain amino acid transport system ATP-binding protein